MVKISRTHEKDFKYAPLDLVNQCIVSKITQQKLVAISMRVGDKFTTVVFDATDAIRLQSEIQNAL